MNNVFSRHARSGFTIVELLIVVVVIAILAAITTVAFTGIQTRAFETAIQADLHNSATRLEVDNASNGQYPSSQGAVDDNKGLPASPNTSYQYTYTSADNSYCLTAYSSRADISTYYISSATTTPQKGRCSGHPETYGGVPTGTIQTIHGNTSPGAFTSYSDAQAGKWVVHQYYVPATGPSLETAQIVGARLYIPPGSPHIGQTWHAVLIIRTGPDAIIEFEDMSIWPAGYAEFEGSDSYVEGAPLVAGWNEVLYPEEYPGVDNNEAFLVGTQIGDGTHYVYNSTLTTSHIYATGGANFVLSEVASASGDVVRGFYDNNRTYTRSYGIDVMVRVP